MFLISILSLINYFAGHYIFFLKLIYFGAMVQYQVTADMNTFCSFSSLFLILVNIYQTIGVELTIEVEDNTKQCFFQDIEKGTRANLDFQVCSIKTVKWK